MKKRKREFEAKQQQLARAKAPHPAKPKWGWTKVFETCRTEEFLAFAQAMDLFGCHVNVGALPGRWRDLRDRCFKEPEFAARALGYFPKTIADVTKRDAKRRSELDLPRQHAMACASAHLLANIPLAVKDPLVPGAKPVFVQKVLARSIQCTDKRSFTYSASRSGNHSPCHCFVCGEVVVRMCKDSEALLVVLEQLKSANLVALVAAYFASP